MYRLILNGEYREKSLGNLTADYIFCNHPAKNKNTWHSNEWNALLAVMHQKDADIINRETVRQYFNLLQGSAAGNVVVLDAINLSKTIRKAKTNKLQIPEEDFQLDDKVKLRKDTYAFLNDIVSRIENVANAEIDIAKKAIQIVYDCFDDDEVEEYRIVGSKEADPSNNKISNESPLAVAIMHAKAGEVRAVESPNGQYNVEIVEIL